MPTSIVFVDLAGFTALTYAHGDEVAVELIDRFVATLQRSLRPGDRLVKTIGDGALLVSGDPVSGVDLAVRIVRLLGEEPEFPNARAGVNAGPVVERGDDVYGHAVNLAARLVGMAGAQEVLLSEEVADKAGDAGYPVVARGEHSIRSIAARIPVFAIELADEDNEVTDPVCRMRVSVPDAVARIRYGGAEHHFCSLRCVQAFASDPQSYG